jgi:hypothetical protein
MAMNTQSPLSVLARIEENIDSAKAAADAIGKGEYWQRDKRFIAAVRDCLLSNDAERLRWAVDQMRNLSQGFGSYSSDLPQLDVLLDELYNKLAQLVTAQDMT